MSKGFIKRVVLITLMIAIGYAFGVASQGTLFAARQTQYKVVGQLETESAAGLEALFNKMGSEGWELVQYYNDMGIFKR